MEIDTPSWNTDTRGSVNEFTARGGDAAHHKDGIVGRLVLDHQPRHVGRQLAEVRHPQPLQSLAAVRGQGEGNVDGLLFALLGGDQDFVQGDGGLPPRRAQRDRAAVVGGDLQVAGAQQARQRGVSGQDALDRRSLAARQLGRWKEDLHAGLTREGVQ
ncbi:hypothetical protein [Caulobacter sp. UC70_42]|uniref:hypothetical protein n=1 Tax=Caulobacter sp. UC70_42 TaxID=3374551 RepID=UPI0037572127